MKVSLNQRGSSHLVMLLVLGVIVAVGAVGYRVMNSTETYVPQPAVSTPETKVPKDIKSNVDLKKASAALDSTNIDGDVNPNQLGKELE